MSKLDLYTGLPYGYHRRDGKIVDMVCAMCNRKKEWNNHNFPIRIYAMCLDCFLAEAEELNNKHRPRRERAWRK